MRRPNADEFIYSSNQQDNSYLLQEDGKMWRSAPYAYFIIKPATPVDVTSVEMPKVVGAYSVFMIFLYNHTTVAQVERDARNQVSFKALDALYLLCDEIRCQPLGHY